ncbi:MAG: RsmG family class I SAM-dependent methyltransferase [Candidatus Krumholzibacteriia bacterium]
MTGDRHDDTGAVLDDLSDLGHRFDGHSLPEFITELLIWNPQLGLVSKGDTAAVVARLIRQSVDFWDVIAAVNPGAPIRRVADVGSGAGFPGVIWKLVNPDLEITLIERKERRAVYLERLRRKLSLSGIDVVDEDVREIVARGRYRGAFDLVAMLAVAPPAEVAATVETLLPEGGLFGSFRSGRNRALEQVVGRHLVLAGSRATPAGKFLVYQKATPSQ